MRHVVTLVGPADLFLPPTRPIDIITTIDSGAANGVGTRTASEFDAGVDAKTGADVHPRTHLDTYG